MKTVEAPFEMSNLFPKHTGLPFVVWISVRGGARHDIRVKVSRPAWPWRSPMATVAIRPRVRVVEGKLDADALSCLTAWIELNRATLIAYWECEIDTQDALARLRKLA